MNLKNILLFCRDIIENLYGDQVNEQRKKSAAEDKIGSHQNSGAQTQEPRSDAKSLGHDSGKLIIYEQHIMQFSACHTDSVLLHY